MPSSMSTLRESGGLTKPRLVEAIDLEDGSGLQGSEMSSSVSAESDDQSAQAAPGEEAAVVHQTVQEDPPPSFMMLNRDIRYMIYDLLLKSKTPMVMISCKSVVQGRGRRRTVRPQCFTTQPSGISAAICRTSRIIAAESLTRLYGLNTFRFSNEYLPLTFQNCIRSNALLVNRAHVQTGLYHRHENGACSGEDSIADSLWDIKQMSPVTPLTRNFPNLKHLSIEFVESRTSEKPGTICPALHKRLIAMDSDFVGLLLKSELRSLLSLKIESFPSETVDYILWFLRSGQKYVPPPVVEPKDVLKTATKPIRSLPIQPCASCQSCKCCHGVKPAQLLDFQNSFDRFSARLAEGVRIPDSEIKQLLQKVAGKLA